MQVTQPLREEHKELLPHIEALRAAADAIDEADGEEVRQKVDAAYLFLATHLVPHALAEDRALYPVVQKVMGSTDATKTMSRDHVEVVTLIEQLKSARGSMGGESLTADQARELRRVLYGLYALVKVHFAKEEEIYLPLLDERLSAGDAKAMFDAMEAAAHEAIEAAKKAAGVA